VVGTLLYAALAPSTRSSYASAFNQFCLFVGLPHVSADPFVADEAIFCMYVAYLFNGGVSGRVTTYSTVKKYMYAIRAAYLDNGLPSPFKGLLILERTLHGCKRSMRKSTGLARLPITVDILRTLKPHFDLAIPFDLIVWSMCVMAVFGLLRCGEFTAKSAGSRRFPCYGDVTFVTPAQIGFRLPTSKTDVFNDGVTVSYMRNYADIDPVETIATLITEVHSKSSVIAPLFPGDDGAPITRQAFLDRVDLALSAAGFDASKFFGHSFRKGGAQTLQDAGIPDHEIKVIGRWASWCFTLYISMTRERLSQISATMAAQSRTHGLTGSV
jgi:hypothetical protein